MRKEKAKAKRSERRRIRVRRKVTGTPERPRLSVYRSLQHVYAQVIDDLDGRTLVSASSREKALGLEKPGNAAAAAVVGEAIAKRAKDAGIGKVVFDRGPFRYHGRIKAMADAARKAGLEF